MGGGGLWGMNGGGFERNADEKEELGATIPSGSGKLSRYAGERGGGLTSVMSEKLIYAIFCFELV